jgi:hypothetical protein
MSKTLKAMFFKNPNIVDRIPTTIFSRMVAILVLLFTILIFIIVITILIIILLLDYSLNKKYLKTNLLLLTTQI